MSKKIRIVLLACVTILCCLVILVCGSLALFTDVFKITNHLQAGTLKVKLYRTSLTSTVLNARGELETLPVNSTRIDFSSATSENVFGVTSGNKIAPGCSFEATMSIENGGDVAFNYWLEINLDGASAQELASQLTITVTSGTSTVTQALNANGGATQLGSDSAPVGKVELNGKGVFTVKLQFVETAGNAAQDKEVTFDLIVHAVQATK